MYQRCRSIVIRTLLHPHLGALIHGPNIIPASNFFRTICIVECNRQIGVHIFRSCAFLVTSRNRVFAAVISGIIRYITTVWIRYVTIICIASVVERSQQSSTRFDNFTNDWDTIFACSVVTIFIDGVVLIAAYPNIVHLSHYIHTIGEFGNWRFVHIFGRIRE